ncbi:universal stress protein [Oceanobacillus sp. CAU 1775]
MKIAVAVDGSDNAFRAVKHAILLAQYLPEAHLEIINVANHDKAKDEYLLAQNSEGLALKREQKLKPIRELAESVEVEVKVTILKGNPSQEIIRYVKEQSIDQLVIGSRGLNTFQEMVLGSVSHKIMKHAHCPVTIVK